MLRLVVLLTLWALVGAPGDGADWTQFRGPNANGLSDERDGLQALANPQPVTWKTALPGQGVSSPIVVGDRVFVTCSSGPREETLHLVCLATADGSVRWQRQLWATGHTMCHPKTAVAGPTPTSDGHYVYALFSSGDLLATDLDGNLLWLRGLHLDYPNANNSLGLASSLLVTGQVLVVQLEADSQSLALGLDTTTGVNHWKLDRPREANWTSPVLVEPPDGRTLAALQSSQGLVMVDPATGETVSTYEDGASTIASSAVSGRVLYIPSHGLTALQFQSAGEGPRQLWRSSQLRPGTSSPLVLGGHVYVVNSASVLTCGAATDGTRLWQLRLKGPFSSSPVAAGNHLCLFNEKGLGQLIDLSGEEGEVVRELDLGETILSTPAIAYGALYVRSDEHLWKLGGAAE